MNRGLDKWAMLRAIRLCTMSGVEFGFRASNGKRLPFPSLAPSLSLSLPAPSLCIYRPSSQHGLPADIPSIRELPSRGDVPCTALKRRREVFGNDSA